MYHNYTNFQGDNEGLIFQDPDGPKLTQGNTDGPPGRATFSSKRAREASKTRCPATPGGGGLRPPPPGGAGRRVWEFPVGVSASFGVPCDAVSRGFRGVTQSAPNKRDAAAWGGPNFLILEKTKIVENRSHF